MGAYTAYRLEHIDKLPLRTFVVLLREIPHLHNAQIARIALGTRTGMAPDAGEHIAELLTD